MKKRYILLILLSSIVANAEMTPEVMEIQKHWAEVNYLTNEDAKEKAFENLAKAASNLVLKQPQNPHALVWEGIVYSTYAGVAGTFSAGKLAKHAKQSFEKAIEIDGDALNGSAYTSLGVLYYKVPGWPLSFGSDKKALKYLQKGLELNPDGIDSNYFFADFLYEEEDEYEKAKQHLIKAQNATPRPGREVADKGRQAEIKKLLSKVEEELEG